MVVKRYGSMVNTLGNAANNGSFVGGFIIGGESSFSANDRLQIDRLDNKSVPEDNHTML